MCDIFGTGSAAKKVAEETEKQSNLNREAEANRAAEERAYQDRQTAQTRALEAERYGEQSRIQSSMQAAAAQVAKAMQRSVAHPENARWRPQFAASCAPARRWCAYFLLPASRFLRLLPLDFFDA